MKWFYALPLMLITLHALQAEESSSSKEDSWSKSSNSFFESFISGPLMQLPLWAIEIKELSAHAPLAPDATMLQETPQKLLQQAIQRQEHYRENSLKMGYLTLLKEELIRAEQESQACYQLFLQAKNYNNATLCLVERGNSLDRRKRLPDAKEHYNKALELAETHHLNLPKAKALNGLARLAVDEKSDQSMAGAERYAQQAEQLCEKLKDYDCWIMALDQLVDIQSFQGNLNAALRTADKILVLANKTSHPMRDQMLAYITRYDIYFELASTFGIISNSMYFNFTEGFLRKAQNDLEQAITFARRQGYKRYVDTFLLLQLKEIIRMRDIYSQQNKLREVYIVMTREYSHNRYFYPRYAEEVNVMKNFISPRDELTSIAPLLRPSSVYKKLIQQGWKHEFAGKSDLVSEDYSKAVELLEYHHSDFTGINREVLLATIERQNIYSTTALYLLQQKRNSEAFSFMERARARYTADLVVSGRKAEWITPQE